MEKRVGRPAQEIDPDELRKLMQFRPSIVDVAGWFSVSEDTISRRIKDWEGLSFREFRDKYMSATRISLVRKALSMALEEGDRTMLIFCLKNLCGWQDRNPESPAKETPMIKLAYSLDDDIGEAE